MNQKLKSFSVVVLIGLILSSCGAYNQTSFRKSKSNKLRKVRLKSSAEESSVAEQEVVEESQFEVEPSGEVSQLEPIEAPVTEIELTEGFIVDQSPEDNPAELEVTEEKAANTSDFSSDPIDKFNRNFQVSLVAMIVGVVADFLPVFTGWGWLWLIGTIALLLSFVLAIIQKFVIAPKVHPDNQNDAFRRRLALAGFIFVAGIVILSIIVLAIIFALIIWW